MFLRIASVLAAAIVLAAPAVVHADAPAGDRFDRSLRRQLQARLENPAIAGAGSETSALIETFYWDRDDRPAWLDARRVRELAHLDTFARSHGLDTNDYRFTNLARHLREALADQDTERLARLELLATKRIAQLIGDLRAGRVDPAGLRPTPRRQPAPGTGDLLAAAVQADSLIRFLDALPPQTYLYQKLRFSLAWHRALLRQGVNWPQIPDGKMLEPGMSDPRVPVLRERLGLPARDDSTVYDDELAAAVADFQSQHLLDHDGVVGPRTTAALNVSIRDRIDQLRVNLDWQRWASLPDDDDYLLVNVAHFRLDWMQNGERTWSTRTQVGRRHRQTPALKTRITAIMVNPSWTVPPTIFRKDMLPALQADPGYLAREGLYVVDRAGNPVDSSRIDWQEITAANFPYRLRARPGRQNALGQMKFLMPNPWLIYLHDTPSKHLFEQQTRAFSSGCIRIEQPRELAERLLDRQARLGRDRLDAALAGSGTRYLGMDREIPIVVVYATVDLDDQGELVFAPDVYGKDARVLAALNDTEDPESRPMRLAQALQ